jgi:uncharacterized membrane protein
MNWKRERLYAFILIAFMGELLIVPRDLVQAIDISAADAMKFMVSGGVTGWDDSKENELK